MNIGVFDSGLGGLTVVRAILDRIPNADIYYVADTAFAPYGEKSDAAIRNRSRYVTDYLVKRFHIKASVVACNTATTVAIRYLRDTFPDLIIVGTEPGIKPAAKHTKTKAVGVLATPATLQTEKYRDLARRVTESSDVRIFHQACPGLVDRIEAGMIDHPETASLLRQWLEPFRENRVDTIVLGCTHYPLVAPLIQRLMPYETTLVDTGDAIAKRLCDLLACTPSESSASRLRILATGEIETGVVSSIIGYLPPINNISL